LIRDSLLNKNLHLQELGIRAIKTPPKALEAKKQSLLLSKMNTLVKKRKMTS